MFHDPSFATMWCVTLWVLVNVIMPFAGRADGFGLNERLPDSQTMLTAPAPGVGVGVGVGFGVGL